MSQLPAGRELDTLIAEKVTGWMQMKHDLSGVSPQDRLQYLLPHYSIDIAAAFQLLEKMAHWDLDFDEDRSGHKYVCEVGFHIDKIEGRGGGLCMIRGAWAKTAPLAICHAALKVIAEEKPCES